MLLVLTFVGTIFLPPAPQRGGPEQPSRIGWAVAFRGQPRRNSDPSSRTLTCRLGDGRCRCPAALSTDGSSSGSGRCGSASPPGQLAEISIVEVMSTLVAWAGLGSTNTRAQAPDGTSTERVPPDSTPEVHW